MHYTGVKCLSVMSSGIKSMRSAVEVSPSVGLAAPNQHITQESLLGRCAWYKSY